MALLAFDTCFGAVSVAVRYRAANGDWTIREAYEPRQTGHAERLMPMIAEVMAAAGTRIRPDRALRRHRWARQFYRRARRRGGGTGIRTRGGAAGGRHLKPRGDRRARARTLLGARDDGRTLMVAVDARRGGLYCALHRDGINGSDVAPMLLTPDAAVTMARDHGALVIGSGGPLIAECATTAGHTIDTELASIEPHARFLALLAADRPPTRSIAPLYLRSPDVRPQPGPIARQP